MDATTLLVNSLSNDRVIREEATRQLELLAQDNYPTYAGSLCQILANESADDAARMSAGLALKNSLTAKDFAHWIAQLLKEARTSRHCGQSTKETARWAKEMIKRATQ
ncbi:hypothetical protein RMATCC62417_11754 [Rhizopus microsporus]|nr:hypothetical protein RMATCC62417_11754 [Rhizopus microsporus]